ncbi:Rz-like lysis system protein LysB [Escherichia coli]
MNRLLLVLLALLLVALGWQTWRLADASQTISTQADELQSKSQALAKSNSQLISLSILTETNNREQARLYAEAEQTSVLLRQRQRRIEELKRENEDLRHWADTPLPADIIRLRERPALTGGAAYRQWLSASGRWRRSIANAGRKADGTGK